MSFNILTEYRLYFKATRISIKNISKSTITAAMNSILILLFQKLNLFLLRNVGEFLLFPCLSSKQKVHKTKFTIGFLFNLAFNLSSKIHLSFICFLNYGAAHSKEMLQKVENDITINFVAFAYFVAINSGAYATEKVYAPVWLEELSISMTYCTCLCKTDSTGNNTNKATYAGIQKAFPELVTKVSNFVFKTSSCHYYIY